jgi:polysaccharide export outer membrane protein
MRTPFAALIGRQTLAVSAIATLLAGGSAAPARGQSASSPQRQAPSATAGSSTTAPRPPSSSPSTAVSEYVIGPEDVLGINFWREAEISGDVTVRPDGRVTLPLIGDVQAAGLTPEALKQQIHKAATKLFEDPTVTVVVRQINSRKVFITGSVTTPGAHALTRQLTVMQLIAMAGGLTEFADKKNIRIVRTEDGKPRTFKLNYNDVAKGNRLEQNIVLQPGDTVIVP